MKKRVTVNTLHGKFDNIVKLSLELEKIPRNFGTGENLSSNEIRLIEVIGENESLSVTDLAKLQGITKGAVSQSLKRMEKRGLTTKEGDPGNSSRSLVLLTNKGKTAYFAHKHWHETMDGGFKAYFENLEQDKIDFLDEFLSKMETFYKQRIKTEK
jgi:DNA-binding MarR family transcriptional regulator